MGQTKHVAHRKWRKSKDFVSSAELKTSLIIETSLRREKFTSNDFFTRSHCISSCGRQKRSFILHMQCFAMKKSSTAQHFTFALRKQLGEERIRLMFRKTLRIHHLSLELRGKISSKLQARKKLQIMHKKPKRDKMSSKHEHKK